MVSYIPGPITRGEAGNHDPETGSGVELLKVLVCQESEESELLSTTKVTKEPGIRTYDLFGNRRLVHLTTAVTRV